MMIKRQLLAFAFLSLAAGCATERIVPAKTAAAKQLKVAVNDKGAKALSIAKGRHKVRFHGGPFLWPTTNRIEGATGKTDGQMRQAIEAFVARGGRLFTLEPKAAPAGAVACGSADELVGAIEKVRDAVKMAMRQS